MNIRVRIENDGGGFFALDDEEFLLDEETTNFVVLFADYSNKLIEDAFVYLLRVGIESVRDYISSGGGKEESNKLEVVVILIWRVLVSDGEHKKRK